MTSASGTTRASAPSVAASTLVVLLAVASTIAAPGPTGARIVDASAVRAMAVAVAVVRDILVTDYPAAPVRTWTVSPDERLIVIAAGGNAGHDGVSSAPPLAERLLDLPPPLV